MLYILVIYKLKLVFWDPKFDINSHGMTTEEFKAYREALPSLPGIYKYMNEEGQIIYIGKAKDLKKRVFSYFSKNDHSNRIKRMIYNIRTIEFVIVDT